MVKSAIKRKVGYDLERAKKVYWVKIVKKL